MNNYASPTVLVFVSLLIKCSTVISCVTFPGTIDLAVSLNYLILVPVFYTRLVVYMLSLCHMSFVNRRLACSVLTPMLFGRGLLLKKQTTGF